MIIDNPDFEYIACLHVDNYNGQNVKKYIEQTLEFGNVDNFKAKKMYMIILIQREIHISKCLQD